MESEQIEKKTPYIKVFIYSALITFSLLFIILFIIPYIVNNWLIDTIGNNDSGLAGSWISFWGSFLGGIIGTLGVICTTFFIIKSQKEDTEFSIIQQDKRERDRMQLEINMDFYDEVHKFLVNYQLEFVKFHSMVTEYAVVKVADDNNVHRDTQKEVSPYFLFNEISKYSQSIRSLSLNLEYYIITGKNSGILDMGDFLGICIEYEKTLNETSEQIVKSEMKFELSKIEELMKASESQKVVFQKRYMLIISDIAAFKSKELNGITNKSE